MQVRLDSGEILSLGFGERLGSRKVLSYELDYADFRKIVEGLRHSPKETEHILNTMYMRMLPRQ